jgi:hypothetical protein
MSIVSQAVICVNNILYGNTKKYKPPINTNGLGCKSKSHKGKVIQVNIFLEI